jgi:hypothetical protein
VWAADWQKQMQKQMKMQVGGEGIQAYQKIHPRIPQLHQTYITRILINLFRKTQKQRHQTLNYLSVLFSQTDSLALSIYFTAGINFYFNIQSKVHCVDFNSRIFDSPIVV